MLLRIMTVLLALIPERSADIQKKPAIGILPS